MNVRQLIVKLLQFNGDREVVLDGLAGAIELYGISEEGMSVLHPNNPNYKPQPVVVIEVLPKTDDIVDTAAWQRFHDSVGRYLHYKMRTDKAMATGIHNVPVCECEGCVRDRQRERP